MSDPESLDVLVKRFEAAMEQGALAEAHRLIDAGEARLGPRSELTELRRRLAAVEAALSQTGQTEAAIRQARAEMSRADYHAALSVLESAVRQDRDNSELREMIQQTTKAALRHEAAVERNRAVAAAVNRIGTLIDRADLETASSELSDADLRFGKHDMLLALRERLESLSKQAELERTVAFVDQGRAFLDSGKWHEALRQAERILRTDPRNQEALEVKNRARSEIEREEAERLALQEVDRARQDIDRLIAAHELVRASNALQAARDRLGRHEVFDQLAGRLDRAKADLQAQKRLEWTQRRLNEADDLVRQAGRLSLQGHYEQAIGRLSKARELHPEHPEIEDMLQAAETASARARSERLRAGSLQRAKSEIHQLLDALRLDEAESRLEAATHEFGGGEASLQDLGRRLGRLREVEGQSSQVSTAAALDRETGHRETGHRETGHRETGHRETGPEALARQQELARAYSWKQTFLFAFRGEAVPVFWAFGLLFVLLETLAATLPMGGAFLVLRWLALAAALALFPIILRQTYQGNNSWPGWEAWLDLRQRGVDLLALSSVGTLALLPLFVLVVTRGVHGLFTGSAGWGLAAILGWAAAVFGVLAGIAAGSFGYRHLLRFPSHVRALKVGAPQTVLAANVVYGAGFVLIILRVTLVPFIPWIGLPIAALAEAFALLSVPHMIGVVARSHRIELAQVYEPA